MKISNLLFILGLFLYSSIAYAQTEEGEEDVMEMLERMEKSDALAAEYAQASYDELNPIFSKVDDDVAEHFIARTQLKTKEEVLALDATKDEEFGKRFTEQTNMMRSPEVGKKLGKMALGISLAVNNAYELYGNGDDTFKLLFLGNLVMELEKKGCNLCTYFIQKSVVNFIEMDKKATNE